MERKNAISIVIWTIIIVAIAFANGCINLISTPVPDEIVQLEIDFITISTVFIGFAFTSLSILLGLSSEKLIQRIKDTKIIMRKVARIVESIVFLMLSIGVALYFILGINNFFAHEKMELCYSSKIVYIIGLGFLVIGIVYYAASIYELYDLIKRIYESNKNQKVIDSNNRAKNQMEKTKTKLDNANFQD